MAAAMLAAIATMTVLSSAAGAQGSPADTDPAPVACLCVADRLDIVSGRMRCEEAAAGLYAAGLIRPVAASDAMVGLPGCDAAGRAGCGGEFWLCFGVGTAGR